MSRTHISPWLAAAALVLVGCSESRVAPENETCLGAAPAAAPDYVALGMPSAEPDLQAWVIAEQHGMARVTTRPCDPSPKSRMIIILPEARVATPSGTIGTFSDVKPGQKVSVWYLGGAAGKARAVTIERVEPWPPGKAAATPAVEGAAQTPAPEEAEATDTPAETPPG